MSDLLPHDGDVLDRLGMAERMLAEVATTDDAKDVMALAGSLEGLVRQLKLGTAAVNHAVLIKTNAMCRLADLVDEGQARDEIATAGGNRQSIPRVAGNGLPLPVPSQRLNEYRRIRDTWDDEARAELFATATADDNELSTAALLNLVKDLARGVAGALLVESAENEWYTPAKYIEAARKVLGDIDLDPATSDVANETVKAPQIFTRGDDGLGQVWQGRVWLNPPYGRLAGEFVTKLVWDHQTENVTAAVVLVNAHCTDTAWFQPLWDYTLCFTDHRIDFDSGGRDKHTTSTHGSVFAYLGPDRAEFAEVFSEFGAIVRRWP